MKFSENRVSHFAETTFHRRYRPFGIKGADRLFHLFVIGRTGTGKSSLLALLARGDIAAGTGFALIDPHGDLAAQVVRMVPPENRSRLVYLNAADPMQPYGYNPLRRVPDVLIPLAASGLMETFRKLWPSAWGVRMEHLLRSSLYALLEQDNATLPDILRLYADKPFRRSVTSRLRNPVVRAFWQKEYPSYPPRYQAEMVAPILNRVGALLSDPILYRILVNPGRELRFRRKIDQGDMLVVNLAKGRVGEDSAHMLGGLLVSTLGLAALSRSDLPPSDRCPFHIYADEFQAYTTLSFANQMAELRKTGVGLTLATQHLAQLEPDIRAAVLGNAGSLIAFRVGAEDAPLIAREFQPVFGVEDLLNLPNRHFYTQLMIDGAPSRPFSARTLACAPIQNKPEALLTDPRLHGVLVAPERGIRFCKS